MITQNLWENSRDKKLFWTGMCFGATVASRGSERIWKKAIEVLLLTVPPPELPLAKHCLALLPRKQETPDTKQKEKQKHSKKINKIQLKPIGKGLS